MEVTVILEIDKDNGIAYIHLAEPNTKVGITIVVNDYLHIDFDQDAKMVGIEIMDLTMLPANWNG